MSRLKKALPAVNTALKVVLLMLADVLIVCSSYFLALYMRFDFAFANFEPGLLQTYFYSMPLWCAATVAVFFLFRLYHSVWSFAGSAEVRNSVFAYITLIPVYCIIAVARKMEMPVSYYIMGFVISFIVTTVVRLSYRFIRYILNYQPSMKEAVERVMIIGGGAAARILIREMREDTCHNCVISCAIDDNPYKKGKFIEGVRIVGDRHDIVHIAKDRKISKIVFAIPSCPAKEKKAILNLCKETGCKLQTIPSITQLVNDEVTVQQLRDVNIADLLGRDPIRVDNKKSYSAIEGKVVLVTGGGGSIGSELCRKIAKAKPKKLVIFDIYENSVYDIQQELKQKYKDELDMDVLIGSVDDAERINSVMQRYKPHLVFHAAAHKHVPLMEDSPHEAIKNNVYGTYQTALAAEKAGVHTFVLISTDKAVNPTNIMGASKRLCEMVVQMMGRRNNNTRFVAVRFGNVLGSNGSVIPLFKKQIAQGGPITITDKRIVRYFMTISEAVSLVIQASHYAQGGEIFVLDMGEPMKIDDMARNLIRLSGFKPDVDIKIVYTGLRPGEKLYEELLMDEEGLRKTESDLIFIGKSIEMDDEKFLKELNVLFEKCENEQSDIRSAVAEMVPTYHPSEKK